jgi:hypothetical protein
MSSLRERLARHREQLVSRGALLRGELVTDLGTLRQKISVVARIAALVPLVQPLLSIGWRHWRRRRAPGR